MSSSSPAHPVPARPAFVVGIGASAGGLEALERLFKAMPLDTGMAFVVIQHLSPDYKSLMDELMARFTRLTVVRVAEPVDVQADTIYLLPPSKEMVMDGSQLVLVERMTDQAVHLPISRFFRSLAHAWGDRAIAIVLSGTGSDGSTGVRDVHAAGGLVLAQAEQSAKFDGMPRAAIATGSVDQVLAPEAMPACLVRYAGGGAAAAGDERGGGPIAPGQGPTALLERLRDTFGIDFTLYKPATINRRVHRRMEFGQFRTIDDYCQHALSDPIELDEVCRDLLIGVTRFFRDAAAFDALREQIIPELVAAAPVDEDLRVWVSGCATGEEAYSLAMLFVLELERRGRPLNLRVFASDVHRESLRVASDGVYGEDSLDNLPDGFRDQFFVREPDGRFRIAARIRKRVLFSAHNVLKDVPFNRIDMVSCRNLLIYFLPEAQTRALAAFYFALRLGGVLLLGPSETAGELESHFETLDRTWKLYRKAADARISFDPRLHTPTPVTALPGRTRAVGDPRLLRAYDTLLERYVPAGVLVDDRREQQYVFGDGSKYLRPPSGRATLDVVAMCEGDLRVAVSAVLSGAARRRERVEARSVRTGLDSSPVIDVVAEPLDDAAVGAHYYLLRFVAPTVTSVGSEPAFAVSDDQAARLRQLEAEVHDARESFHAMLEEVEATNEELQASNEELIAGNEELQSTNEELQSVNEELHSVNAEYNAKIRDLAEVGADLRNLIAAAHAGIIFVDDRLGVRLYTPGAAEVLNLLPQDIGRSLAHITSRVADDDLLPSIDHVRASRAAVEATLELPAGRYFLRRVQPYQDADGRPDGFVITFTDVTLRKRAELAEDERHQLLKAVIDASSSQIAVVDRVGVIIATNKAWDEFGVSRGGPSGATLIGSSYFAAVDDEPSAIEAAGLLHDVLAGRRAHADLDYPCNGPDDERWFWMNVTAMPQPRGGAVVTHTDITERRRASLLEQKLQESAKLESLGVLAGGIAHDFNNILTGIMANVTYLQLGNRDVDALSDALADVHQSAIRATELCRQMLAFSGRGRFLVQRLSLATLVRESTALIRASLARGATLDLRIDAELPPIEADGAQIQQVVMNLVINAAEALPPSGGMVRIATGLAVPEPRPHELEIVAPVHRDRMYVAVEVTDDGAGIEPAVLRRIFDPFFTTKVTGRGLGLAAVLGIVRGHEAALYVRSAPGHGTTFRMLVPVSQGGLPAATAPTAVVPIRPAAGTTVLVVDDEDILRRSIARILEHHGFRVATASSGPAAIDQVGAQPDRFHVVLLDLTMPGPDGVQTMAQLRQIAPALPIVVMSGFAEDEVVARFGASQPTAFMQKPVGAAAVIAAVSAALPRAAHGG